MAIALPEGKTLRIARDAGVGIASNLFWRGLGGFEAETSRALRELFPLSRTFLDVGANCGFYSALGGTWNPQLRITAFEPVPEIFQALERNITLNGLQERVVCENVALAAESGEATLFLPETESKDIESTGTLASESWQARKGSPRIQVRKVRFDEYEQQHPMHLDLVKIDVEDFEADVLAGMQRVIRRDKPFIVCEILPREHRNQRTMDIVTALGYQPYWITPPGYIRVPRLDFPRRDFTNFLLSPVSTPDPVLLNVKTLWDLRGKSA